MKRFINKLLPQNGFARGVSVLVGGTTSAQALMVLASPLLTRLYSPEDFGLLAVYSGLLALFTVIASLRYELAIPLPERHVDAVNVSILSLIIVLTMAGISGVMVLLVGDRVANILDTPNLAKYFWLLPVGVLLSGIYKVFNYWTVRVKGFGDIAKTRISQTLVTLAIQLLGYKLGGVALLIGQAGGQGIGSFRLARRALKEENYKSWSWIGICRVAKRYKQLPLFSIWSGLFNTAGGQLPPLMFAALFSTGAAGLYALAHRILAMPMSLVGDAVGKVFFSRAAEAYREGLLAPLVEKVHGKLAEIAMPITVLVIISGPELFALIFGESWRESGYFARYMSPWLYMVFITSPLSTLFSIMEKERFGMFFQTFLLLARLVAILVGSSLLNSLLGTVIVFSGVSALFWIGFLIWVSSASGNKILAIFKPTLKAFSMSAVIFLPLSLPIYLEVKADAWLYAGVSTSVLLLSIYYLNIFRKAY